MNGLMTYSLDKNIVEVVVKELMIDDQDNLDGDIAMCSFELVKDEPGDVQSYTFSVKTRHSSTMCWK